MGVELGKALELLDIKQTKYRMNKIMKRSSANFIENWKDIVKI
jgi:hypothetical protein